MTCRGTETLDLAAFLARGTAPEFAAFRAHYPRCAECAAEVRAWSELHAALSAPTHPPPETLLRYDDGRLAEGDRGVVARHLEACAPCRDELRALAAFDRQAARAARAAAVEPRRWLRVPRLLMHPALAYGLVLALLFYPSLRGREPAPSEGRGDVVPAQKTAEQPTFSDQATAPAREGRAAPAEQPASDASERLYRRERPPAAPQPAPSARAKPDAGARASDAAPLAALGKAKGGGSADVAVVLRSDTSTRLDVRNAGEQITFRIPVDPVSDSVEVRVVDQSRERQLRERGQPTGGYLSMQVPTAWLLEGSYRVEVHGAGASADSDAFVIEVAP